MALRSGRSTPGGAIAGPGPGETTRWAAVLSLMAAGVVAAAQIGKASAALPVLQDEFGLSTAAAAWFLSLVSAIGAVLGAVLGWLGQAIGFRRQVLLGLLAIVLASAGGAVVPSGAWLLTARAAEGLGLVLVVLAAPAVLPEVSAPERRRLVVGAWGAYMPVGAGLATLLVPGGVALVGWRGTWLVDAGLSACVLLAVARWVPATGARQRAVGGLARAVRSPGVLCLAAVFGLYAGQYLAVVGLLPAVLVADGGLSLASAGLVSALVFLVNAPGNVLGAVLLHRGVRRPWLLVGGSACMAVTVWGVLDAGLPLWARIAAALAFSATAGLVPAAAFSGVAAMSAGTSSAGAAVGLLMQGSSIGQLVGPPLAVAADAAVASWAGRPATLACLAVLALLGGLAYRRLERPLGAPGRDRQDPGGL
ncbi:CynX/NimT family MFS transporter [Geodermatophilus sp. SYSU D00697]